jgi:protein translocase SEC61 complex gamma subunit
MGINEFLESTRRLMQTLNRPDWKTFSLSLKIVLIGVGILGAVGYIIRLIAVVVQPVGA